MNEYIEFKEEYPFIEWNNQFLMEYSIFCESDDNLTDDIEESAPGLYEQWLKLHDYDPKTNTIMAKQSAKLNDPSASHETHMKRLDDPTYDYHSGTIDRRVNVGRLGSNKERNRLNKFLKENDFDPKTGTYRSDIKLPNGQYARIPLNIHVSPEGKHINGAYASNQGFTDNAEKRINRLKKVDDRYIERQKKTLADYENMLENEPDPEMKDGFRDLISQVKKDIDEHTKKSYNKKDIENDVINDHLKTISTNMPKRHLMRKPSNSNSTLKHEEGHHDVELNIGHGNMNPSDNYSLKVDFPNFDHSISAKTQDQPLPEDKSMTINDALNAHDRDREEQYADKYSAHNNKYNKSKEHAVRNLVGHIEPDRIESYSNEKKRINSAIKALNYYKDNHNKIKNNDERGTKYEAKQFKKLKPFLDTGEMDALKHGHITPDDVDAAIEHLKGEKSNADEYIKRSLRGDRARGEMLKAHLKDSDFKQSGDPSRAPKTNKQRAQERKEKGELPRKAKKQAKKQNVVKEYMI
jgi:hypothetical protein